MRFLFAPLSFLLLGFALLPSNTSAHHRDNGHSGYQLTDSRPGWADLAQWELNDRTTTGQTINVQLVVYHVYWAQAFSGAVGNWNAAIQPIAGFNVFTDVPSGGSITVNAGSNVNICGFLADNTPSHGCVSNWSPQAPSGQVYMYADVFSTYTHRLSDLMHELGHVLYYAGEHYALSGYGCGGTASIMNHCFTTAVETDDKADYRSAYRIGDTSDATYAQMPNRFNITHLFEGTYFGGTGRTVHQEQYNWVDRSINDVGGSYTNYFSFGRKVSNADDGSPQSDTYTDVPSTGNEWCFKRFGIAGGVSSAEPGRLGPYSRAYCVMQSYNGTRVFVASNRNDYVAFRIYNYSSSTINFVSLLLNDNSTHVCDFPDIPPNGSQVCFWYPGNSAGFVRLWYGFQEHGPIGYDAR